MFENYIYSDYVYFHNMFQTQLGSYLNYSFSHQISDLNWSECVIGVFGLFSLGKFVQPNKYNCETSLVIIQNKTKKKSGKKFPRIILDRQNRKRKRSFCDRNYVLLLKLIFS